MCAAYGAPYYASKAGVNALTQSLVTGIAGAPKFGLEVRDATSKRGWK
jgi:NAD(P)-dependent dehydrogenase (short-subunit alcohol dehydrogenase family)